MNSVLKPFYIKFRAKKAMQGKFGLSLGAAMLPMLIVTAVSMCVLFIPAVRESLELIIGGSFENSEAQADYITDVYTNLLYTFNLVIVLFNFLMIGGERISLDIIMGRETSLKKLFAYYDRWYVALIWPMVTFVTGFLADMLIEYMYSAGVNEILIEMFLLGYEALLLFVTFKTAFISIALADGDCKSFISAFKTSWRMTNFKTIMSIFLLYMSFIGWFLLIAFALFPVFYVMPYFYLSFASLYQSVKENMEKTVE